MKLKHGVFLFMADITITIKKRDKSKKTEKNQSSKKPLLPTFHAKKGGRRRLEKSGGFINFYDLAQIKDGSNWITKNVSIVNSVSLSFNEGGNPNSPNDYGIGPEYPTDAEYQTILSGLIPENLNTLKSVYRKINLADAPQYPIFMNGYTNLEPAGNWTEKGLRLEEDERTSFYIYETGTSYQRNHFIDIADFYTRITRSREPEGEQVTDFVLSETANIFILPKIALVGGFSESVPSPGVLRRHTYGQIFRFKPRFFSEPDAITEADFPPGNVEALSRANSVSPSRSFYFNFNYPPAPSGFSTGGFPSNTEFSISYQGSFVPETDRYLYAIIEQNNQFYFVWSN